MIQIGMKWKYIQLDGVIHIQWVQEFFSPHLNLEINHFRILKNQDDKKKEIFMVLWYLQVTIQMYTNLWHWSCELLCTDGQWFLLSSKHKILFGTFHSNCYTDNVKNTETEAFSLVVLDLSVYKRAWNKWWMCASPHPGSHGSSAVVQGDL